MLRCFWDRGEKGGSNEDSIWVIITIRLLCLRFDENKFMHGKKFGAAAAFVVVALPHHGFNATAAPLLRQW